MKAEFKEGILTLRSDTNEEKQWLDKTFTEGLRVFGGGTCTTACLPSTSNVKQFHFTDKEIAIVQGSIKQCESVLLFIDQGNLYSVEKKLGMASLTEFVEKVMKKVGEALKPLGCELSGS